MTDHNTQDLPERMSPILEPQVRAYPFMFAGKTLELAMYPGWHAPFAQLCRDIDAALGEDKQGFHWVQLKEKFGQPRWYWEMQGEDGPQGDLWLDLQTGEPAQPGELAPRMTFRKLVPGELQARIRALVDAATDACAQRCMDCGEPGTGHLSRGWMMVLCGEHAEQRRQAGELHDP